MAKVDDYLKGVKRPEMELSDGTCISCDDQGDMEINSVLSVTVERVALLDMVDWIIDTYGITPTGFEKKGGA